MLRFACILGLLLIAGVAASARHIQHSSPPPPVFQVGGLQFKIPDAWLTEPSQSPARAAQWTVPVPHTANGASNNGVEVVVFFFGPGVGGSVQENIDAWARAITTPDGKPATAVPQKRTIAGHTITEVIFSGTCAQAHPQPGRPPASRPGYALIGAGVENPGGTIYWRVTGPAAQVMAFQAAFDQVLGSLVPAPAP